LINERAGFAPGSQEEPYANFNEFQLAVGRASFRLSSDADFRMGWGA